MKMNFYPKLAFDGIRKNKRLYFPYILTCVGMVAMYYIISFLQSAEVLSYMRGSANMRIMLLIGSIIIAIFAAIFLFYTNSFLIRRRKKEFGLYNILGMGKRNIGLIIFWESFIITIISLVLGLIVGVLFSKLAELGIVNLLQEKVIYTLSISFTAIYRTTIVFFIIFTLLFLNTLRQVKLSSAINLINSENVGEKAPKANWLLGVLGGIILAIAYYLSITTLSPMQAIPKFFIAVIMVIVATYLLFISGSVLFCRILQNNKKYYYKANHFVSVSSMLYRMKRNGAGLASICILVTMVLVMVSSTTSLYFGSEDIIKASFPREINVKTQIQNIEKIDDKNINDIRSELDKTTVEFGGLANNLIDYRAIRFMGTINENTISLIKRSDNSSLSNMIYFYIIPLSDYNKINNSNEILSDDEAMIYSMRTNYKNDSIKIENGKTIKVKKYLDKFVDNGNAAVNLSPTMYIVLNSLSNEIGFIDYANIEDETAVSYSWNYCFDTNLKDAQQMKLNDKVEDKLSQLISDENTGIVFCTSNSRAYNKSDFYSLFGSLFFLGIVLSAIFIFSAVLIIYYKQISEGYEDKSGFEIMQKVGMTKKEIRNSINSQLLTVFFLPLIGAGTHLAFAFPIIRRLLLLFNLNNVGAFAFATVVSFLVFAVFYTFVYRVTSNAYYKIVSEARK